MEAAANNLQKEAKGYLDSLRGMMQRRFLSHICHDFLFLLKKTFIMSLWN